MHRSTYVDCEFLRDDLTSAGLLSLGLTDRNGNDYYAVNADMDEERVRFSSDEAATWLREHVWLLLPRTPHGALDRSHPDVKPIDVIRDEVGQYYAHGPQARMFAYYGGQDGVRVHGLWGHDWGKMPSVIPQRVRDLADLAEDAGLTPEDLPVQTTPAHHALWDAQHDRAMHDAILNSGRMPAAAEPKVSEQQLRELAISALRRGPGMAQGRTKQELAEVMPPWMRDAVDAYVPGLGELRASAETSQARYSRALVEWLGTLD